MTAIAICYLITPFLQYMRKFDREILFTISAFFMVLDIVFVNAFLYYVFLYSMSYFISSCKRSLLMILRYLFFMVFCLFISGLFGIKMSIPILFRCFIAIVALVATLNVFRQKEINFTYNTINWLSKYSYYLYLVHVPIILGPFSLLYFTESIPFNIIVILCMTIISALSLYALSSMAQFILQHNIKSKRNA